jgi:hypothetical protein
MASSPGDDTSVQVRVERPVLSQENFHDVSEYVKPHNNSKYIILLLIYPIDNPNSFIVLTI